MAKALTSGEQAKIDKIVEEIVQATRSGPPVSLAGTTTFSRIKSKGERIRLSRAISTMIKSGEINTVSLVSKNSMNHALYSAGRGPGRSAGIGAKAKKKGFWASLWR